jgi:hypothetical protein
MRPPTTPVFMTSRSQRPEAVDIGVAADPRERHLAVLYRGVILIAGGECNSASCSSSTKAST